MKTIRLEYESYLTGLSPDEQADAREQMRPVLKQLTEQSVERMETVVEQFAKYEAQ